MSIVMKAKIRYCEAVTSSNGIMSIKFLAQYLGLESVKKIKPGLGFLSNTRQVQDRVVLGWGVKSNAEKMRSLARSANSPFWHLEDGFISYLGHPAEKGVRVSLIVDPAGIYYDAGRPSALENLINTYCVDKSLLSRAESLLGCIKAHKITKYNHTALPPESYLTTCIPQTGREKILVVDQTRDDLSISKGLASERSFNLMLERALADNPNADVYLKYHPDVLLGKKDGHFSIASLPSRVTVLKDPYNPLAIVERMDKVYTVTSQLGFEALLLGKSVVCFGVPFYSGWGLTQDYYKCKRRTRRRNILELLALSYLVYPRYLDPQTGLPCELENLLELLIAHNKNLSAGVDRLFALGFSYWKRSFIQQYMGKQARRLVFINKVPATINRDDRVLVWGRSQDWKLDSRQFQDKIWRVEDGFLRSVGLGSDLYVPNSLVVDRKGIYYDTERESDLENILLISKLTSSQLYRARSLGSEFKNSRVSKYNIGRKKGADFRSIAGKKEVILIPGQVEDDASLRHGTGEVSSNIELLKSVRQSSPDAFIVYKPHPDVVAGNRYGKLDSTLAGSYCDLVVTGIDIIDCICSVDSVHTMTSLSGFEALLYGKKVVCYGRPFYSGWGLTIDKLPPIRARRKLCLEELIHGVLIEYPLYLDSADISRSWFTTPERMINKLSLQRAGLFNNESNGVFYGWLRRQLRKIVHLWHAWQTQIKIS